MRRQQRGRRAPGGGEGALPSLRERLRKCHTEPGREPGPKQHPAPPRRPPQAEGRGWPRRLSVKGHSRHRARRWATAGPRERPQAAAPLLTRVPSHWASVSHLDKGRSGPPGALLSAWSAGPPSTPRRAGKRWAYPYWLPSVGWRPARTEPGLQTGHCCALTSSGIPPL